VDSYDFVCFEPRVDEDGPYKVREWALLKPYFWPYSRPANAREILPAHCTVLSRSAGDGYNGDKTGAFALGSITRASARMPLLFLGWLSVVQGDGPVTFHSFHPAPGPFRACLLVGGMLLGALGPVAALGQAPAAGEPSPVPEALNFANALLRDKHYARAAEEYERFLKDVPAGPDAVEALYGLARARLFLGKYKEARKHYEQFLVLAPNHPSAATALFRVGETSYMSNDLPAARKALEAFTAANPTHRDLESAWPYLGDIYYLLSDFSRARHAYEQALTVAPHGRLADSARYGLGCALAAQGNFDAALKLLSELVDREAVGFADKAQNQIGQVRARTGKNVEAIEAFETLERVYPRSPLVREARLGRAKALLKVGRRDDGEALLAQLAADPVQGVAAKAAYDLGMSQLERGRAAEARATFEAAAKRFAGSPAAPGLLFGAAEAAQKEGRADLARAGYQKMAEAAPDDPQADLALLRAARLALDARDYQAAQSLAGSLRTRYAASSLLAEANLVEARAALSLGAPKRAIQLINALLNDAKPAPETAQAARYYLHQAYKADGQNERAAEVLETLAKTPAAPVATDAQFLLGQEHFQAGRFAEAIGPLEKYLAGKPQGEVAEFALAYLAAAQQAQGQTDAALTTLEKLADQYPTSKMLDPTRLRLADASLAAKQFDHAAKLYKPVADGGTAKWKVRSLSGLGRSLLWGGKPAEAAQSLAARLEADATDSRAPDDSLALGCALDEAGQSEEALAAYTKTIERYAKTDSAAAALLARARLLAKLKRPAEAARDFGAYLQNPLKKAEGIDVVLADWGWALLDSEKNADSDKAFRRLLQEFPDSPRALDARLNLAESAYQAQNYDEVARLLEPLVAPGLGADAVLVQSALYRLGRTCVARKNWQTASRWFERLLNDYPGGPFHLESRFWKAEVAFQGGDAKSAEPEFAALAAEPANAENQGWIQTVRLRRVQSLVMLERWQEGLEQADALRASAPNHPQISQIDYARGRALQGLARFEEARASYQGVIDARKGGDLAARAQLMRGETFFHENNYSEALREFLKVNLLYDAPQWQAAALLEAGKVYERLAQWTDSAEMYKKLLDKFPTDPSAAEASRRLGAVQTRSAAPTGDSAPAAEGAP
jgi:cellulose synthase operon protein C